MMKQRSAQGAAPTERGGEEARRVALTPALSLKPWTRAGPGKIKIKSKKRSLLTGFRGQKQAIWYGGFLSPGETSLRPYLDPTGLKGGP